jgi:hypothetical protein|tara:strand:- start:133 stop:261 length:129 start_codon:yes stop_codon:yes gene_type:complete
MHFLYALTRHGKLIASLQGNIISFKESIKGDSHFWFLLENLP